MDNSNLRKGRRVLRRNKRSAKHMEQANKYGLYVLFVVVVLLAVVYNLSSSGLITIGAGVLVCLLTYGYLRGIV